MIRLRYLFSFTSIALRNPSLIRLKHMDVRKIISPGSAAFLHRLGAWQALPGDRIAAVETMRVAGDDGAEGRLALPRR